MDIKGEAESIGMIKPIRFNIQAWGEREVSVTRLPALSQSALVIKALAVRELGGESKLQGSNSVQTKSWLIRTSHPKLRRRNCVKPTHEGE